MDPTDREFLVARWKEYIRAKSEWDRGFAGGRIREYANQNAIEDDDVDDARLQAQAECAETPNDRKVFRGA